MSRKLSLICGMLISCSYTIQAQDIQNADAVLNSVTVYKVGAELKHSAKVNLPQGNTELIINNVASNIDESSIQINAPSNITIMSVMVTRNYKPEQQKDQNSPEYKQKEALLKTAEAALQKTINKRQAIERTLSLLAKNEVAKGDQSNVNVAELSKLTDFYLNKQIDLNDQISALKGQEAEQVALVQEYRTQLGNMNGQESNTGGQLVLQVMSTTPVLSGNINISYISRNAGWTAAYDLKADKVSDPLRIVYKANVAQQTGLDWKKVKLILSTGNPTVGSNAPILTAWLLRYGQVYQPTMRNEATANTIQSYKYQNNASMAQISADQLSKMPVTSVAAMLERAAPGVYTTGGGQPGSTPDIIVRGQGNLSASSTPLIVLDGAPYSGTLNSINPNDIADLQILKDATTKAVYGSRAANGVILITTKANKGVSDHTEVEEKELDATFDIDIPYSIASNNKPHSVSLKELNIPVSYKYYAVPKLDPDAFLLAEVNGYEKLNLIPGEANIVFENTYVGKTFLNPYNTQDTLNLSMGRDKRITIKREKVTDLSASKVLGSNKKQSFTYELTIKNSKKEAIDLLLKDQYPISTDNNMEIELLSSDNAAINKETGILTWKLNIKPGETRKVRFTYSVKYPKDQYIGNL
ncbi:mucoidy inhibitor MuiA family protein [Edaphocola aurantiacus]|uniref:mucoidy inhibitor MuiA family protein n=1 Tax=Edaphocola aurantiacus TaxID=2601682 RepID=UPI001C96309D|nr:mucoidy inhibitor MuiA family protein [Edaphocola aurantiacus]